MKIFEIKIECIGGAYLEKKAYKISEIHGPCDLDELCDFVLKSFGFENDHLHEFFISKGPGRGGRVEIKDETKKVEDIFPLGKGRNLFMYFDFGDEWMFKITGSCTKVALNSAHRYPRIIKRMGKNPEQYPMYEDEDEDEDA